MARRRDHVERLLSDFRDGDGRYPPALVQAKMRKLRRSPYRLFRATSARFIDDLSSLPGFRRAPAHELHAPPPGDPHPESFGAVGASAAAAQMDCTDFDSPAVGPLVRDRARAAVGLAVARDQRAAKDGDAGEKALDDDARGCPKEAR